jgi:7,8-dihydroneopterin aldolase/epimerase/oxygenase
MLEDRIILSGLEFHGFHGVFPEEATLGARFIVDVELYLTLPKEDDLAQTVDYSKVYTLVRQKVTEHRFKLIEVLANTISDDILLQHSLVQKVVTRVHKPHAPLPGVVRDVVVEVCRLRS